jgi:antitoxin (DNA-binding transcriptional repressor) of toxin-antitoxin stability system
MSYVFIYFKAMKQVTPSQLRADIYKILDKVLREGRPIEIKRKGAILKIIPPKPKSRLSTLKKRKICRVDPESLVHLEWEREWKPKLF